MWPSFRAHCFPENKEHRPGSAGVLAFGRSSSSIWGRIILMPSISVCCCSLEGEEVCPLQWVHFVLQILILSAFLLSLGVLGRLGGNGKVASDLS